ncbi:GH3 domain-containing protein isoform X2 [Balaenoptera musculus]|uniref:GH3 domain-containing protein isoform X2 n=1 Tax=Balaenoptera musculus TaxID=9771 RepID=A0A8B8WCL4_BALMU|nr:GH3 domain-containing protein isoform X2 [Balaenoptera musculus]
MVLFLLLFFLLLPLAVLWRWRRPSQDAGLSWLVRLQHRVAWGALRWAAAWQRKSLAQSTLHAGQSQQRALRRCLQGAQSPRRPLRGSTDIGIFRNHLPLTKASQLQEEESGGQLLPPTSNQYRGEASLQATLLGLAALKKTYPEVLAPEGTARVTPSSPWPYPLPWPWHALGQLGPAGTKDPRALLLEALRSPGLRALEAGTAVELLDVFLGLEADGEELAEAIAAGNPGAPLPRRAAELREALEQGPRGLALRLWPKLQVVVTLDAGGQAEAVAALGALWCQGLAFFSPAYAASGGALGLSLWPEQPHGLYLLPPGGPFIELLPLKEGTREEAAPTVLLAEAQKGKEYELVLTDHTSLTRCRLGDVVQVVGAYNQCPVVRFICRLGQTLSVRGEDTGEDVFSEALGQAVGQWPGARLLDHGCVESSILDSSEGSAPHYEVFVALKGLRNLSEENRDKVHETGTGYDCMSLSLCTPPAHAPGRLEVLGVNALRSDPQAARNRSW